MRTGSQSPAMSGRSSAGSLPAGCSALGLRGRRCSRCGQGLLVALSCKGRGGCPSCTGRRMAQTAAHLADPVIPPVPVRQWVISVLKRLRCILADRPQAMMALSQIFLGEIERLLCNAAGIPAGTGFARQARPRLGAVSFQHRFGSALNQHVHLHACVADGKDSPVNGTSASIAGLMSGSSMRRCWQRRRN